MEKQYNFVNEKWRMVFTLYMYSKNATVMTDTMCREIYSHIFYTNPGWWHFEIGSTKSSLYFEWKKTKLGFILSYSNTRHRNH